MERRERFPMESSQRMYCHPARDEVSSEEDASPTSSSDEDHRSHEDVRNTSSSDISGKLNRISKKLERLTRHIDQHIEILNEVNNSFVYRRYQPANMEMMRQQMTWGETLSANRGKVRHPETHCGRYLDNGLYKPQCRTVEIRSSSKEHLYTELPPNDLEPRVSAGCYPSCCCCDQYYVTTYNDSYGTTYPSLPICTAQRKVTDLNTEDMCRYRYFGAQPNRTGLRQAVSKQKKPKVLRSSKSSTRVRRKESTSGVDKRINSKTKEKMAPATQQRVSTSSNSPKINSPILEPLDRVPITSEFSGNNCCRCLDENRNDFSNTPLTRQVGTEAQEERFTPTSLLCSSVKSTQVYSRPIYYGAGSPRRAQEESTLSCCEVRVARPHNIDENQFYSRHSSSEEFVNFYDGTRVQSQLSEEISSDTEEPLRIVARETEVLRSGSPQRISQQSIDSEIYETSDYTEEDFREMSPRTNSLRNDYPLRMYSQQFEGEPRNLSQEDDESLRLSSSAEDEIQSRSEYDRNRTAGSFNSNQIDMVNLNWQRSACCQDYEQNEVTLVKKRTRRVTFQDEIEKCVEDELKQSQENEMKQRKVDELKQSQEEEQRSSLIDWSQAQKYHQPSSTDGNTPRSSSSGENMCIEDSSDEWESYKSCEETLSPTFEEMPMPNICPCMYEQYRELEALCRNIAPMPR